ncbi:predicted protein [Naegleria gruberi]|uniref:Trimethylguanosine synthase n=1 Tax=Naegleria gruberi TaxID=5762 RepID=D2VSI3_NAEGR|nr:uncharacterized protein NAEGRDRAFT_71951 [Naegleria gruberi]EFC40198.1 predicted protein [Naegleria gruberi]|eukprot:XP_002672942.1 predicted protein [Naegleria gruberi strain NEG-M]
MLTPSGADLTTTHLLKTTTSSSQNNNNQQGSKLLMMNNISNNNNTTTNLSPRLYQGSMNNNNSMMMMMAPPPPNNNNNMWWNHQPPPPPQQQQFNNSNLMMMFNNFGNVNNNGGELAHHGDVAINTSNQQPQQQQQENQFYHHQWMMNNPSSGMWPPHGMMMGYPPMMGMCSVDDIEKSFFNEPTEQSNTMVNTTASVEQPQQSHFLSQLFPQNSMLNNDINTTTSTPVHVNYPNQSSTVQNDNNPLTSILVNTNTRKKQEESIESPTLTTASSATLMNEIKNLQIQLKAALKVLELEKQKLSTMSSKDTHYIVANQTLEETIRHVKKSLNIVKKKQTEEEKEAKSTSKPKSNPELPRTLENHYKFRKYSENMYGFFPKHLVNKVRFDSELALSYLTPFNDAFEIASLMNEMIKQKTGFYPNHLVDGTGGLGGNIIGFLRYFWSKRLHRKTVTMIELDERRCNDARYNINLFENEEKKYDRDCVTCNVISGNFIDWWQKERGNLGDKMPETFVFFDPPWGNQDYSLHDFIDDLYMIQENLTPISVKTFSKQLLLEDGVQCVALKVPYNFSESGLPEELEVEYILMKKVKYIMLFRKTKPEY